MKQELPFGFHRLSYATTAPILLSLGGTPLKAVNGSGTLTLRRCGGILEVDNPGKAKYSIDVTTKESVEGEQFDELPPPQPAPPPNYLAKIRQQVKQSMGIVREEFADQGKSIYETGDVDIFEEDLAKRQLGGEAQEGAAGGAAPTQTDPEKPADEAQTQEPGNPG